MSSVEAEIDVAKIACDLLKETPLTAFGDGTAMGRWMARNFTASRNSVLAETPWGFAIKRAALSLDATVPAFGWTKRFAIPGDCLRILPLRVGGTLNGTIIPYEREGGFILSSYSESNALKIRYIFEQTDAKLWSPLFIDALATRLALKASMWITGKNSYTQAMTIAHSEAMTKAMFANGAEGTATAITGSVYDDVRGSGYSYTLQEPYP